MCQGYHIGAASHATLNITVADTQSDSLTTVTSKVCMTSAVLKCLEKQKRGGSHLIKAVTKDCQGLIAQQLDQV